MRAGESLARERARQQELLVQSRRRRPAASSDPEWVQQLVLAADQFVVARSATGTAHAAIRLQASRLDSHSRLSAADASTSTTTQPTPHDYDSLGATVIAGYPWFSDWGRDTMIALPGLTLSTGRLDIAASMLRTFAQFVSDGMLPNRFPDAAKRPSTTPSMRRSGTSSRSTPTCARATTDVCSTSSIRCCVRSSRWHQRGTRYGIHVDASDGLLYAGEPGVQLTWMDAKIGDWVVTPRIGKPVEINALWFNALAIMRDFAQQLKDADAARDYASAAERVAHSFNERFWFDAGGYLYDVIDAPEGADASLRPESALRGFAAASAARRRPRASGRRRVRERVVDAGRAAQPRAMRRCTLRRPLQRRSARARRRLPPGHGVELVARTVRARALPRLPGSQRRHGAISRVSSAHLHEACIGQVSEIFDGDAPFTARGCFAQAWGVAEILRVWGELDDGLAYEDRRKTQQHAAALRK